MNITPKNIKPLGFKAYGSIGHLPQSRLGPTDSCVHEGQARICTEKTRDKHDRIIVTEKLDGSNVAIANLDGKIIALGRAGYRAETSPYLQHNLFAEWVKKNEYWLSVIPVGHSIHGEWIVQAHGTRYGGLRDGDDGFIMFDFKQGQQRLPFDEQIEIAEIMGLTTAKVLSDGPACTVRDAMMHLGEFGHHGALELTEGAVWRVERKGEFDFMAKYVRPGKVDGKYLSSVTGKPDVFNFGQGGL